VEYCGKLKLVAAYKDDQRHAAWPVAERANGPPTRIQFPQNSAMNHTYKAPATDSSSGIKDGRVCPQRDRGAISSGAENLVPNEMQADALGGGAIKVEGRHGFTNVIPQFILGIGLGKDTLTEGFSHVTAILLLDNLKDDFFHGPIVNESSCGAASSSSSSSFSFIFSILARSSGRPQHK
jgi:hypothetical protein